MLVSLKGFAKKVPGARWLAQKVGLAVPPPSAAARIAHGPKGIRQVGHREYVGGYWELMGQLQFDFLVAQGLQPHHYLCDIACGSLRAGVHFVRYLEAGHYLGIEKEEKLIEAGISELGDDLYREKRPELVASSEFEYERFSAAADYALAQSLFTHLPPPIIEKCMSKLRAWIKPNGAFFASFFCVTEERDNPQDPHDHLAFSYTRRQMESLGEKTGWVPHYIGNWNHPRRHQEMMKFTPRS